MKFQVRKNEKVAIYSEVFATREEAEKHVTGSDEGVSFVAQHYAPALGYPCGGFVVNNAWNKPKELHVVAL